MDRTFYSRHHKCRYKFPATPVGPHCRTVHHHTRFVTTIQHQPKTLLQSPTQWCLRFQQNFHIPSRYKIPRLRNTEQKTHQAPHVVDGWYIGYAPNHYRCYRCYRCYIPKTRSESIRTVEFFPHDSEIPNLSSAEATAVAATEFVHALSKPSPTSPLSPPR